jgi:MFS family permease
VSSLASLVFGALVFALTIYVPVFAQGVLSTSATQSGVVLLPLLLTWVVTGFVSGQLISRTGRYKIFPVIGSTVVLGGVVLLGVLGTDATQGGLALSLGIVGAGMGMLIQSYIIATQNDVQVSVVGTATAALQFFRSMGGSLAVAGLGALLAARLATELPAHLGAATSRIDQGRLLEGGAAIPADLVEGTHAALGASLHTVFLVLIPIAMLGLVLALRLEERPLTTDTAQPPATTRSTSPATTTSSPG